MEASTCTAGSGGLGDRISDGEPTARQVPDTTLDSQLMEGITHLEHLVLRVSLDSGYDGDIVSGAIGAVDSSIIVYCTTL